MKEVTDLKVARFFALIFAILGVVLMLGTVFLAFTSLDKPVGIMQNPDGALLCSEQLQECLNGGDLAGAGKLMYGQPSFGTDAAPQDGYSAMLWNAYVEGISFTYTGNLYLLDSELARDGVLTVLNVPELMESVQTRARALLDQKVASTEDSAVIYDEAGNLRSEVADQILQEAVRQALEQDVSYVSRNVTVRVIRRNDGWWILPDQTFQKTLSGLTA